MWYPDRRSMIKDAVATTHDAARSDLENAKTR